MIKISKGDLFKHQNKCVIPHCCNNVGCFGAGFVASLNKVSDLPRKNYMKWYEDGLTKSAAGREIPFELGEVQYSSLFPADASKIIANIIGQDNVGFDERNGRFPVRYWAIRKGLENVRQTFLDNVGILSEHDIVSPLIGCNLAGGYLDEIYYIIKDVFGNFHRDFYLYAFSDEDFEKLSAVAELFA